MLAPAKCSGPTCRSRWLGQGALPGQEAGAWEYDAKQALLKHSEKLGLSYQEHLETEAQLAQVINNEYGNF